MEPELYANKTFEDLEAKGVGASEPDQSYFLLM